MQTDKDLTYARIGDRALNLDLYWHPEAASPLALIIWIHGGAWRNGSKENPQAALSFIDKSYAIASINYRLSAESKFPTQIQDCKAAVRWLRAHAPKYNLNSNRFAAWGSSAGGHLVALLGTTGHLKEWDVGDHLDQSSQVQAVCDWCGPTNFYHMNDVPGNIDHDAPDSPESELIGGAIHDHPDRVALANPITHITSNTPPFLIMHGVEDLTVLKNQGERLHKALRENNRPSTLILLEGVDHGIFKHGPGRHSEILGTVESFFDDHLKQDR